jgi:hypothetical protein
MALIRMQIIRVSITSAYLQFRCEDEGKVCQSSVRFPCTYFTSFAFSGVPSTFSVQLTALADALRTFAAMPDVAVVVTETPDCLVLETAEVNAGTSVSMYAHLAILATSHTVDLMDHWQPPATEFTTSAVVLREAVEDLEWPQGHVRVLVQAQPLQARFPPLRFAFVREVRARAGAVTACAAAHAPRLPVGLRAPMRAQPQLVHVRMRTAPGAFAGRCCLQVCSTASPGREGACATAARRQFRRISSDGSQICR